MKNDLYDPSLEAMPAEERVKYLDEKLRKFIQSAYNNARGVKKVMDKAGVTPAEVHTVKDLERLPIIRKDDFVELQTKDPPFGGFLAVPTEDLERICVSPGPIYETLVSLKSTHLCAVYAAGFRKGDRAINAFSYHLVPAGLGLDANLRKIGVTVIPTGVGNTQLQVRIMHDLAVTGYAGTPSFLLTLIKKAEELGYNFQRDFSLRKALFTAEKLSPGLRKTIEEYGVSTADQYGTAELGTLAFECSQKSGMHIGDDFILEIVDSLTGKQLEPGQVGEVVVTSLDDVFPLLRYGLGDLSSVNTAPCPCGRTSNRLTGILGRVGEETKVRGMFIHPKQVEEVMAKLEQVANFQIIVTREGERDELAIHLELNDEAIDRERLTADLTGVFQEVCRTRPDKVDFLPTGAIEKNRKAILDKRKW